MSQPIASLGMYDHPGQRAANDRLWVAIRRRLVVHGTPAPIALDRSRPVEAIWRDPALLFGQACGYPLVSDPELALRVIGVPVYDAPDCAEGRHASYLIGRHDDSRTSLADYRSGQAAINGRSSNTGYNLFRAAVAPLAQGGRFFGSVVETGSHRGSLDAIRHGRADIAAIDTVTHAVLRRFEPSALAGLRIVGLTASSPTLPFVTARSTSIGTMAALRIALADVVADSDLADVCDALLLSDIVPGGAERFEPVRGIELAAITAGYPTLR